MVLLCERGAAVSPKNAAELGSFTSLIKAENSIQSSFLPSAKKVITENQEGVLYVGEGEWATIDLNANPLKVVGSDEATTCHIVVIRSVCNDLVSLGHFNGWNTTGFANSMIKSMAPLSEFDLHMVGGFLDNRNLSAELAIELLDYFQKSSCVFHLKTACFYDLNNGIKDEKAFPILYGLAFSIPDCDLFPADFTIKGPDFPVRSCRMYTDSSFSQEADARCCYDLRNNLFVVNPIRYKCPYYAEAALRLPPSQILQHFSTSPDQEREGFVEHIREGLSFMLRHKNWETVFPRNQPRRYKLICNKWELV